MTHKHKPIFFLQFHNKTDLVRCFKNVVELNYVLVLELAHDFHLCQKLLLVHRKLWQDLDCDVLPCDGIQGLVHNRGIPAANLVLEDIALIACGLLLLLGKLFSEEIHF